MLNNSIGDSKMSEILLEVINDLIEDEAGNAIGMDTLLTDSGLDSFGFTMVVISLDDKYSLWTPQELEALDYTVLTPRLLIDLMEKPNDS